MGGTLIRDCTHKDSVVYEQDRSNDNVSEIDEKKRQLYQLLIKTKMKLTDGDMEIL